MAERYSLQPASDRFAEAARLAELAEVDNALRRKLGPLTDAERDRALKLCTSKLYEHPWGYEKRVFYGSAFLVGFSVRWFDALMCVAVKTDTGHDTVYDLRPGDYK